MAQLLPVIGVVAAVCAAGAAFYGDQQLQKLDQLRGAISTQSGAVETNLATLRGQQAAVDERMQALRAIAATPEMPVSGAELQAQINRLLTLRDDALEIAADDPTVPALARSGQLLAEARDTRDAVRTGKTTILDEGRALVDQVHALGETLANRPAPRELFAD